MNEDEEEFERLLANVRVRVKEHQRHKMHQSQYFHKGCGGGIWIKKIKGFALSNTIMVCDKCGFWWDRKDFKDALKRGEIGSNL